MGWPGEGTLPRIGLGIDGLIDGLQILSVAPSAEDIQRGMNGGIQLAVQPAEEVTTTWGRIKPDW